jgi:hypothetical protein
MAAILVLAVTACGGGKGGESTATAGASATVQWASGVCTAFTTWKTSVKSSLEDVKLSAHPSSSDVQHAGNEVRDATETLQQSLKDLGKPDTKSGAAAKQNLDTLRTVMSNDMDKIDESLKPKPPTAAAALQQISTVSATLAAMVQNITLAVGNLKKFEPNGELEQAFHEAPSCAPYFSS